MHAVVSLLHKPMHATVLGDLQLLVTSQAPVLPRSSRHMRSLVRGATGRTLSPGLLVQLKRNKPITSAAATTVSMVKQLPGPAEVTSFIQGLNQQYEKARTTQQHMYSIGCQHKWQRWAAFTINCTDLRHNAATRTCLETIGVCQLVQSY